MKEKRRRTRELNAREDALVKGGSPGSFIGIRQRSFRRV